MLFSWMKNLKTSDSIYELHLEDLIESSSLLSADLFPGRRPMTDGEFRSVNHRKHLNSDPETDIHAGLSPTAYSKENPPTVFSWMLRDLEVWQASMHGLFPDKAEPQTRNAVHTYTHTEICRKTVSETTTRIRVWDEDVISFTSMGAIFKILQQIKRRV